MSGPILRDKVIVSHPEGFHLRPIGNFVNCALGYKSDVYIVKDDLRLNGRNAMDLMLLAATQGTELVIEVCGIDAELALPALVAAINAPLDQPIRSPSPPCTP